MIAAHRNSLLPVRILKEPEVDPPLYAGEKPLGSSWTLFAEDSIDQATSTGTDNLLLRNTE